MQVRRATRADVPGIVELLADDDLGRQREHRGPPLPDDYWSAFDAIDRDPNHQLVVLDSDDPDDPRPLGCLQVTFLPYLTFTGGWRAQIEAVRVREDRRGEGHGRTLFAWAIDAARRRGCHLVQLTTNVSREDARRFYDSLGFTASHHGLKLYLDGDVTGRSTGA